MAQCIDGNFYYQRNRDNAGYGSDARIIGSGVHLYDPQAQLGDYWQGCKDFEDLIQCGER